MASTSSGGGGGQGLPPTRQLSRRLTRVQTMLDVPEEEGQTADSELVPSSLAFIVPILRVANEIEPLNPRVAYLCRFHAFEEAHYADATSSGRGVKQFKTYLLHRLTKDEEETQPTLATSDPGEIQKFYQYYYETYIREGTVRRKAEEMAKHHQTASVLYDVLQNVVRKDRIDTKVGLDVAEAQHLFDGLDWQGAVKDIKASVDWLKSNGSSKVGVTGYCMGGALAIASGVLLPKVDAVVAFYGVPSAELADLAQTKSPIQAHFGELDTYVGFSDVTAAKSLEEKLKSSGVPHEVHIYPKSSHAFMNASPEGIQRRKGMGLDDESPEAVSLAWSRFGSWMGRFLSG